MFRLFPKGSAALTLAATIAASGVATAAWAHHSFAMYDPTKQYVFTGIVVRVAPNPDHQQIYFVPLNKERTAIIRNAKGEPYVWLLEMEGAALAAKEGITVQAFQPGAIISSGLFPLRSGQPGGTRGAGASQQGASVIVMCPANTAPEPGKHCDSVKGSKFFGTGQLPKANAEWQPTADAK